MDTRGYMTQFFDGVAIKKLSSVEASKAQSSNQHELNGTLPIQKLFGRPVDLQKINIPTRFYYLSDEDRFIPEKGTMCLYDARAQGRLNGGANRSEIRLYYPTNDVTQLWNTNDTLIIARVTGTLEACVIVAKAESAVEGELLWLFDSSAPESEKAFRTIEQATLQQASLPPGIDDLLSALDIPVPRTEDYLDEMLYRFGTEFPATRIFSEFARQKSPYHSALEADADTIIDAWYEMEEQLYKTFEFHLLNQRIAQGFTPDTFLAEAKSVMNRRKSRAGQGLENHLEQLFIERKIRYTRTPCTEAKSKPDFIFPGIKEYKDPSFDAVKLHMLGAKTSCKDRWRQVLVEADRIPNKHLITMDTIISTAQTDEMRAHNLQLVIPASRHARYSEEQRLWLFSVEDFIKVL
ncbi:MAG: hypothetical protein IKY91_06040 [Akkermansia sp.]|nr:hypothetical protein [Akkermansia sp.]